MAYSLEWKVKSEPEDFVTCKVCGYQTTTLARHLLGKHKINADQYREQYPSALIRCTLLTEKRKQAAKERPTNKGKTKTITCPGCGVLREVGWSFAASTHDARCEACRNAADVIEESQRWEGKEEGLDFVYCSECRYRAENLTSHVQNAHPDLIGNYRGQMVALNSAVRDKAALLGTHHTPETKALMSRNAGRWNKGLTKSTHPSMAKISEGMMGRTPWSKGLTKAQHPSLQSTADKLSKLTGERRPWSNGLRADLTGIDFTPYLDETGAVDRKTMADETGFDEVTVTKYMKTLGLRLSTQYVDARAERQTICLEKEEFLPYTLRNGKVVIGRAMVGLRRDYKVIKRECERHGLSTFNRGIRQTLCLEAVSKALGGARYEQEWEARRFVNPSSGRRFRFDGYFQELNLIVEFHGHQHYVFPSFYIRDEKLYCELQERDRIKENMILADPVLRYLVLREDEPYTDVPYIRRLAEQLGIYA
jgi:ribosomal protein S27E